MNKKLKVKTNNRLNKKESLCVQIRFNAISVPDKYKCFTAHFYNKIEQETIQKPLLWSSLVVQLQLNLDGAMEKSKPSRRGRNGTEIKSVGQCCHPVLPALAPTSFHLCGCADPLRMAFHYSSTDNNRRIHFGAISGRWSRELLRCPPSFSH